MVTIAAPDFGLRKGTLIVSGEGEGTRQPRSGDQFDFRLDPGLRPRKERKISVPPI